MDASPLTATDASGSVTADAGLQPDAAVDASSQTVIDAAGIKAPSVAEVTRILSRRCGDCHQNEGPDGFVFEGRLRSTLLAAVEVTATPQGELPGAADCRLEKRVLPGDANSYLIRKFELGLGRTPQPRVCGQGMPRDLILEPQDYLDMAVELEQLKLWILAGAPLQ